MNNNNENDQYSNIPTPTEALEVEFTEAQVSDALAQTPPELVEHIGGKTLGVPGLFDRIIVRCKANQKLADLLLEQFELKSHTDDPDYDQAFVQSELDEVNRQIAEIEDN